MKQGAALLGVMVLSSLASLVVARLTHTSPACEPGSCGVPALPLWRVDLNRANEAELSLLPGVGPALAARIVRDREQHGAYRELAELDRVKGVGPQLLARIRPFVSDLANADAP